MVFITWNKKKFYSSRFSGCIFGDCNLAAKKSDSWRGCSEQPEKIWIKAIDAQKKYIYCNPTIKYHQFPAKSFEKSWRLSPFLLSCDSTTSCNITCRWDYQFLKTFKNSGGGSALHRSTLAPPLLLTTNGYSNKMMSYRKITEQWWKDITFKGSSTTIDVFHSIS
jgi:hypothetical protein